MSTKTFAPILGKRIRVTKLDNCGLPGESAAEDGFIATDGFISVSLSTEVEDGSEIVTKKADGSLCINEKMASAFKRFTVEVELCGVHPTLASWMTSAKEYSNDSDVIGFTVAEGDITTKFALEIWTGLSGVACTDAEEASGYLLLPFINGGHFDDLTVDGENAVSFKITDAYTKGGNAWGVGPYNVLNVTDTPSPLPTELDPLDHLLMISSNLAPPPSADDAQPMPAVA